MRWTPNSTVATIIEQDGKLLFVEETDKLSGDVVINQPAGHLEENESLTEAAVRETLEETGYHCKVTHYLGLYIYKAPANNVTYHRHCFIAEATHYDNDYTLDEGIIRPRWLTTDELIETGQARSPLVIKCAMDFYQKPALPLSVIYEHN